MFLAVSRVFRGIMGCSRGVPGLFRAVPGCSGGVPGVFRGCSGVFRGCSGVFRGVPGCSGFYRHPSRAVFLCFVLFCFLSTNMAFAKVQTHFPTRNTSVFISIELRSINISILSREKK